MIDCQSYREGRGLELGGMVGMDDSNMDDTKCLHTHSRKPNVALQAHTNHQSHISGKFNLCPIYTQSTLNICIHYRPPRKYIYKRMPFPAKTEKPICNCFNWNSPRSCFLLILPFRFNRKEQSWNAWLLAGRSVLSTPGENIPLSGFWTALRGLPGLRQERKKCPSKLSMHGDQGGKPAVGPPVTGWTIPIPS